MKATEIRRILDAEVLCGAEYLEEVEISSAFGADMMSDMLAYHLDQSTLVLTGTVNRHVIRTVEMLDIRCVVFVRGKSVPDEIISNARALDIIVLNTDKTLFTACGILYEAGLRSCSR
ncbi:MAG TPA: DRTGG domain-containing protein [Clostridia bacterium]|nr:MAG: DRTGG domain protein [Firmicutes bacterium ADurb.Bin248]HOG00563.1 DRTGG domain-containing protein [Clostridia bacterium]HOS18753.1 DRTGG domain-containing protein [Clostridia bacterium]HPK14774.1 DRTGG domain-containing protein [Clostridia bacterium]